MKAHFDLALQKSQCHMKSQGQSLSVWWSSARSFVGFILPISDVETWLACASCWADVKDSLDKVTMASPVGQKMFSSARRQLQEQSASVIVQKAADDIMLADITKEAVQQAQVKMTNELAELGLDPATSFPRREIQFKYRGVPLKTHVHSLMDKWQIRKESAIREVAVRSGHLEPLWCETDLTPSVAALQLKVEPELL